MDTMQKVYMDAQTACGLKVGDYVRVTRKAETNEAGWINYWNLNMDEYVGKVGEIIRDLNCKGLRVKFSTYISWYFPYFVLEKVPYIELHKASSLKVGDKVKITRKAKAYEGDVHLCGTSNPAE